MPLTLLILKELRLRWLASLAMVVGISLAVALCVGLPALHEAASRETTRLQRDLGFNLRIIPAATDMDQFLLRGFANETMPEDVVHRLAAQKTVAYNHLVATLQQPIEIEGKVAILAGLSATLFPPGHQKPPMSPEIDRGEAHLGHQIAHRLDVEKGDFVQIANRSFRVARTAPPTGDGDDIRVWVALEDAQEVLEMPGRINEVKAIDCLCLAPEQDPQGELQREVSRVAPEARVALLSRMATARAGQRRMIEDFARYAVPVAIATAAIWVCLLAMANVRQRRQELGLLRAIGYGPRFIGGLFLGKALIAGLAGAILGLGLAWWGVATVGPRAFPITSGKVVLTGSAIVSALLWTPTAVMIASLLPVTWAMGQSPARVLAKEQL